MVGVDVFSGAGGMSLGAVQAGLEVALAVEVDPYAAETYASNHPNTVMFAKDVRRLTPRKLRHILGERKVDIVFGGPPCQGFSFSNLRTRSTENPENWLFLQFVRLVRILRPEWVVFENVRGIVNTAGGVFLHQVVERLARLGYEHSHGLLNAVNFGVPQDRARFFLIGSRSGLKLPLPARTRRKTVTVRDAIGDLPRLTNGASISRLPYSKNPATAYARIMRKGDESSPNHLVSNNAPAIVTRYKYIPQGGNWEDIPARLMRNYADRSRCHTGIYHRLRMATPSVVIGNYRKNMLIHPTQDRGLSVREAARIQSFPDRYEFHGSIGFQQQQVGNAVPPMLAEAVFASVIAASE